MKREDIAFLASVEGRAAAVYASYSWRELALTNKARAVMLLNRETNGLFLAKAMVDEYIDWAERGGYLKCVSPTLGAMLREQLRDMREKSF